MSYEFKRPVTHAELLATLEEDSDFDDNDVIDAVYIPPQNDELTDEETLDDNLTNSYNNQYKDLIGSFELHPHCSKTSKKTFSKNSSPRYENEEFLKHRSSVEDSDVGDYVTETEYILSNTIVIKSQEVLDSDDVNDTVNIKPRADEAEDVETASDDNDVYYPGPVPSQTDKVKDEDLDFQDSDVPDTVYISPQSEEVKDEHTLEDCYTNLNKDVCTYELHQHRSNSNYKNIVSEKCSSKYKRSKGNQREESREYKWIKCEPTYSNLPKGDKTNLEEIETSLNGFSPLDVFLLFFDDEILSQIVEFSTKYAYDNNRPEFTVTIDQLKRFIGILIFSGYHTLPQQNMYWSKDPDKDINLVRRTMSRNEFRSIKQNLHLSDNLCLDKSDKFAKLRPLIDALNQKFLQFGIFSRHLSINEEMVPYLDKLSAKMYLKGKPVRFGFKLWCLCSSTGYLYQFEPYGGTNKNSVNNELGLGANVVLDLLSHVDNPSQHEVYFDQFFSSYDLMVLLQDKGYFAMGTIQDNRIGKFPVQSRETIEKMERGAYENMFDSHNEINVIHWNDNSVVTIITNFGTTEPVQSVKRYNRKEKKEILISQPNAITQYNAHVGGVDVHDNAIANYRIKIRGKKWWWPLFINMIDSAIVNAWKIYNIANEEQMSQLDFRSYIVLSLLKHDGKRSANLGRPSKASLPNEVQYDNEGHTIVKHPTGSRKRCRECRSTTVFLCIKCNVHLHTKCFQKFHSW